MKFKHLIIVSLILAILTIGAVSASQDAVGNDTISQASADDAVSEVALDSSDDDSDVLSYSGDEDVIKANDDPQEVLGDYDSGSVHIEINNYVDISDKYYDLGYVQDTNGLKGTVTVKIDGNKVYTKKFTSGTRDTLYIDQSVLKLDKYGYGYHTVKITYDNGKARTDTRKVNFVAIPNINYPYSMSVGENNGITIQGDGSLDGTATVYLRKITGYDSYKNPIYSRGDVIKTVKISKGYAWIPLNTLTNGSHSLQLEYKYGTYEDVTTFSLDVRNNSPGFKATVSPLTITVGKSISVKLTGPKGEGYASIYIDNKYFKEVRFNFGSMEEVIKGLSVGNHRITLKYDDYDSTLFFSQTYNVVVKDHDIKLKLKKVKIKKSAKKLVIKATLKIDGKVAKNKKLTFKFNKKTYTAKTNKKGVAKITIYKSTLSKLKKGKTVKYQVTYGKKTVKQKVKVKK